MQSSKEKIGFIINPISGTKSKDKLPYLINKLIDKNRFDIEIVITTGAGHATEIAKRMSNEGYIYVVAVGGDGTVNETAQGLIHTKTALGIVPVGSGNGLARHLKISLNTKKAILTLNDAKAIDIDYGRANDKIFFCTCGMGFDAHISQQFALSTNRGIKTYMKKVISEYFTYKPQNYHLTNGEIDIQQDAFLVTFANASQYGNNAFIAPHASLRDGLMDISILRKFPLSAIPSLVFQLFTRQIDKSYYMTSLRTNKIVLSRKSAGAFHFDGEASEASETIEVKIVSGGLRVLVNNK
jgi:YegS/Rv2252/BmrU family lipid kinase